MPDPTLALLNMIFRKVEQLTIEDGLTGRFAVQFWTKRPGPYGRVEGDDLADLLTQVWDTVNI